MIWIEIGDDQEWTKMKKASTPIKRAEADRFFKSEDLEEDLRDFDSVASSIERSVAKINKTSDFNNIISTISK